MKRVLLFVMISLIGIGLLYACNKPKPVKLDYTDKQDMYDPQGLPGESHVGSPPEDLKHAGYEQGEESEKKAEKKEEKAEKKEEAKEEEKKE